MTMGRPKRTRICDSCGRRAPVNSCRWTTAREAGHLGDCYVQGFMCGGCAMELVDSGYDVVRHLVRH